MSCSDQKTKECTFTRGILEATTARELRTVFRLIMRTTHLHVREANAVKAAYRQRVDELTQDLFALRDEVEETIDQDLIVP